jgi:hypothetical protein
VLNTKTVRRQPINPKIAGNGCIYARWLENGADVFVLLHLLKTPKVAPRSLLLWILSLEIE